MEVGIQSPWGSKYTISVNLRMNYWSAKQCALFDSARPVVDLLESMVFSGQKTALFMYGCSGWGVHQNTDIWGESDPQDRWMPAALWPLGGLFKLFS